MPGDDLDRLRRTPAYTFAEAAHYLGLPHSTLRSWFLGQGYRGSNNEPRRFQPLLMLDGNPGEGLSFLNLVEAHVLASIRRDHGVPLPRIRDAIRYVQKSLHRDRPLIDETFQTNGVNLFVDKLEGLVNVSRDGQMEMADLMRAYLRRIDWAEDRLPIRLYPFTRREQPNVEPPRTVVVDPRIAFGRPTLAGRSVPTAVLADRFKAGDTLEELAGDYDTSSQEIEEAIRCELYRQAA